MMANGNTEAARAGAFRASAVVATGVALAGAGPERASASRRRLLTAGALVLLVVPCAFLALLGRDVPYLGNSSDDAINWVCARSLEAGSGYRILSLPDQPYQTKYPPLYPALLAAAWRLWPSGDPRAMAALVTWLAMPATVLLALVYFRGLGFDPPRVWCGCALMALNPYVVRMSLGVAPDLLGCGLLLACLLLAERAAHTRRSVSLAALAGLAGGLACLARSALVPLLAAVPLWLVLRGRRRLALIFAVSMLPAVGAWTWWARGHLAPATDLASIYYTDYIGFHRLDVGWTDLPVLLRSNLFALTLSSGAVIIPNAGLQWPQNLPWLALGLLTIAAVVSLARRRGLSAYHLFAAVFAVQQLLWNFPPWERFILPLLPLFAASLVDAVPRVFSWARSGLQSPQCLPRLLGHAVRLALAIVACYGALVIVTFFFQTPQYLRHDRETLTRKRPAFDWIARNVPAGARLFSEDDSLFLHTGRHSTRMPVLSRSYWHPDRGPIRRQIATLPDFLRRCRVDYVLVTPDDFLTEMVASEREAYHRLVAGLPEFRKRFEQSGVAVYEFAGGGAL